MSGHDPKALQVAMLAAAPDMELSFRPMFGGIMAYVGGLPFASLSNVGLALKFAGAARAAALAEPGAVALRYDPDAAPSKSYVVVPDAVLGGAAKLREWMGTSAAGLSAKPARGKAKGLGHGA